MATITDATEFMCMTDFSKKDPIYPTSLVLYSNKTIDVCLEYMTEGVANIILYDDANCTGTCHMDVTMKVKNMTSHVLIKTEIPYRLINQSVSICICYTDSYVIEISENLPTGGIHTYFIYLDSLPYNNMKPCGWAITGIK